MKEELNFERRMIEANSYSRRAASKDGELALSGWRLDELYGLLGENPLEYEDRDSDTKWKTTLYAKEQNPKISMTIRKNDLGRHREFHGISVDCRMPRLFYGVGTAYYICEAGLCRLDTEFLQKIRIMAQFFNGGALSFQVGRNKLPQFYYSVLPQLEGAVDIMEENAEEIAAFLPPQARFVFYLDAADDNMSCRVGARYGEQEFRVVDFGDREGPLEPFREGTREEEALFLARQWFPYWDSREKELSCLGDEGLMFQVLDKGVDALLALGEVQCTRRFTNLNIGRRVRMSVGISVSKNLLNLDIATQDVPPEELLDILKSYRQKKKYYRLRNGDFLSLEQDALQTLAEMADSLRMSPRELLKGNVKLPLYRALYLDKLLEKNEEIYSTRDSHFREMVKDFKTVNDADFEEPPTLREILDKPGLGFVFTVSVPVVTGWLLREECC